MRPLHRPHRTTHSPVPALGFGVVLLGTLVFAALAADWIGERPIDPRPAVETGP